MIITRTPFRVSFFGGGTDYPGWYREHGGAVLATTIDKYCHISCRHLPPFFEHRHRIVYSVIETVHDIDEIRHPAVRAVLTWAKCHDGLEIHYDGDLPARSGLGSSSAFTVGLIHALAALEGKYVTREALAINAIHIEQNIIQEHVGSQDQISAAFGGFNRIDFRPDDTFYVSPMIVPKTRLDELQSHLVLYFTGFSRIASEIASATIASFKTRQAELKRIAAMVDEATQILYDESVPLTAFGTLLDEAWRRKRELSADISTTEIDTIYDAAISAGATGGKLLGAGGGGFLLLFVHPERQKDVRERLSNLINVPFKFDNSGSRVVLYQPNGLA